MSKADVLKRINRALSPNRVDFSGVESEINALKKKLEETVNIQTVDDVKFQLDKFKKKVDLSPLIEEIKKIGTSFDSKVKEIKSQIDDKSKEIELAKKSIIDNETGNTARIKDIGRELAFLKNKLVQLEVLHEEDIKTVNETINDVRKIEDRVNEAVNKLAENVNTRFTKAEAKKALKEIQDKLDELRRDLLNRIANIGGGNANRQFFVGGNDPLTMYGDINLKAGSNVTITYANNNTTKKAEITIASTGGSGTVRSINSIAVDTTAGSTAGTDYVYLVSGTTTLTLPTAVGNTNLYTVKNVGSGVVTVATTSAQTIDGTTTITMPIQYTAVDIISDSANWNVT